MSYLTLGIARERLARFAENGLHPTDSRVVDRINEATERLVNAGKFYPTVAQYDFNIYQKVLTVPEEIETILAVRINGYYTEIRNRWYEFRGAGPGKWDSDENDYKGVLLPRNDSGTFYDLPDNLRVGVRSSQSTDTGVIHVFGWDADDNRVRSDDNGTIIDGEKITLTGTSTAFNGTPFSRIERIIKPRTDGDVYLYGHYETGENVLLGVYSPNIQFPLFRRYLLPQAEDATVQCITVLAKRRFVPVYADTDTLLIQNLNALRNMMICIRKEDAAEQDSDVFEQRAIELLRRQTREYVGDSTRENLDVQVSSYFAGEIPHV